MKKNPWQILHSKQVYKNPWIEVDEHEVINPSGNKGIYGVVKFVHYAIAIVPIDSSLHTYLVGQWRFPLNAYSWEVPEGGGNKLTDILESAKRELEEECGILADTWTLIQKLHLSNSATDEEAYIFIAENLHEGQAAPEETEQLEIRRLPFEDAYNMAMNGEITDALSVIALMRAKIYLHEKGLIK